MSWFEQFRFRREKAYERLFSARALCITGLLIMPALLFNPFPPLRVFQFLLFWFFCWLAGKKLRPLITILIILFIVAFHLLVPHGMILYSIGRFRITLGALMLGLGRAVTLQGLIMLSRLTIRRDLKIPGSFGELIGESFRILSRIINLKHSITRKNFMSDIDRLMIKLSEEETTQEEQSNAESDKTLPAVKTRPAGFIIIVFVVLLS